MFAGCQSEGTVLQGQPYDGPIDSQSLADFALDILRDSIYHRSNTVWGLADLDWANLQSHVCDGDGTVIFTVDDEDDDFFVLAELA